MKVRYVGADDFDVGPLLDRVGDPPGVDFTKTCLRDTTKKLSGVDFPCFVKRSSFLVLSPIKTCVLVKMKPQSLDVLSRANDQSSLAFGHLLRYDGT